MKKGLNIICLLLIFVISCKDDDINLFDKSADERVAEAIANLKASLVAPDNGWKIKYRPESGSGSFYVLLTFDEDNNVTIKSDLGSNDGEFFEQTVTYRIDSSLGLELIIETYSFFSFLFEQDQATFGAEYEFNYVNKTPDGALVFRSKTDPIDATILLFEEVDADDEELLGVALSTNMNLIASDLDNLTPTFKLTYDIKDLIFYLALDEARRTIDFKSASRRTNTSVTTALDFASPYVIKGDSIVFDTPLVQTVLGTAVSIKSIKFNTLTTGTLNICPSPLVSHSYAGVTSANDPVKLEPSLADAEGGNFPNVTDFWVADINNIFNNGQRAAAAIAQDLTGALAMQLYYNNDDFYGLGFIIQNANGTNTFALRQFTPVITGNKIKFNFAPEISIFGSQQTDANIENVNIYLDAMTEGDNTYVFKYNDGIYEFFNPCTGWSFGFEPIL